MDSKHLLRTVATVFLFEIVIVAPSQIVAADEQTEPNAVQEIDSRIGTLLSRIEIALADPQTKSSTIAEMLLAAEALLPMASPAGRKMVEDFPDRLNTRADEAQQAGDLSRAVNYSVFANVVRAYIHQEDPKEAAGSPPPAHEAEPAPVQPVAPPVEKQPIVVRPAQEPSQAPPPSPAQFMVERGDNLLKQGNVSGARMLYERAADLGMGIAALKLGDTYDSAFLSQQNLRGIKPDPDKATRWYQKAREMGIIQANEKLKKLEGHRLADVLSKQ